VARKKRKARSWGRTLLLFILTPLTVWFVAFLVWFFWSDIIRLMTPAEQAAIRRNTGGEQSARKRGRENIPDSDRKELEELLTER
jgi:hypothetical protein